MFLFALSVLSFLEAVPRGRGRVAGAFLFLLGLLFLVAGGLSLEVNFRARDQTIVVIWSILGFNVLERSHPYDSAEFAIRYLAGTTVSAGANGSEVSGTSAYLSFKIRRAVFAFERQKGRPITEEAIAAFRQAVGYYEQA